MTPSRVRLKPSVEIAFALAALALVLCCVFAPTTSRAAEEDHGAHPWNSGVAVEKSRDGSSKTTTVERGGKVRGTVKLVALLTADGQEIDDGLVWRVFDAEGPGKPKLVSQSHDASPVMRLPPGEYMINAAFGHANLTRKVEVKPGDMPPETFVLNAGGLRLAAIVGGKPAPPGSVTYSIFIDDRDQFDGRTAVMTGAKPNLIIRLNSGIYRIVSQYGDANATIDADVTVEAGKLTETTVTHTGGKATFALVTHAGGEATPEARWTIQTSDGKIVKESVGALPTHILAPGKYMVTAASGGHLYKKDFSIGDGDVKSIEVLMTEPAPNTHSPGMTSVTPSTDPMEMPDFDLKNQ
jgi:hypothetical protein